MKLSTQPYKGTRDFYPEDMRVRKWMFDKWRQACESFGYEEYDGPILEPLELFASKTSDEIVNEQTYSFTDRGDRKVVMRPEMTPTVSRMVAAKRQELGYPLRLYSIPNCFRYERPQKGRLREFWQLNADIFGVEGIDADVEIILLADSIMKSFGAKAGQYEIHIGSRQLTDWILGRILSTLDRKSEIIRVLDKRDKISEEDLKAQLDLIMPGIGKKLVEVFAVKDLKYVDVDAPTKELNLISEQLKKAGVKVAFDAGLMRGFDYYTDIVFEVFDTNPDNNRSMFGGGRYDGLVGQFGVEPVPTVGVAAGDATFMNFLVANKLIPEEVKEPETDIYIATIGDVAADAQYIAGLLRYEGVNVAVDLSGKKLEKQIKTADKKGIEYVMFVGKDDIETGKYKLKNLWYDDEDLEADTIQNIAKMIDLRSNPMD